MLMTQTPMTQPVAGGIINVRSIHLHTSEGLQFIDLTEEVASIVQQAGIRNGIINIQSRHTTAAILVNENEPLLLQDLKRTLERLAPQDVNYFHDDFSIRTVNMGPDEDQNGHAHCKAIFLPTSCVLNIANGQLDLGTWQRIFLLELDRPRERSVSVVILGA